MPPEHNKRTTQAQSGTRTTQTQSDKRATQTQSGKRPPPFSPTSSWDEVGKKQHSIGIHPPLAAPTEYVYTVTRCPRCLPPRCCSCRSLFSFPSSLFFVLLFVGFVCLFSNAFLLFSLPLFLVLLPASVFLLYSFFLLIPSSFFLLPSAFSFFLPSSFFILPSPFLLQPNHQAIERLSDEAIERPPDGLVGSRETNRIYIYIYG